MEKLSIIIIALLIILAWGLIVSLPTLWLWNWLMPAIFGFKAITWAQALGLNVLCSILFKSTSVSTNKD